MVACVSWNCSQMATHESSPASEIRSSISHLCGSERALPIRLNSSVVSFMRGGSCVPSLGYIPADLRLGQVLPSLTFRRRLVELLGEVGVQLLLQSVLELAGPLAADAIPGPDLLQRIGGFTQDPL